MSNKLIGAVGVVGVALALLAQPVQAQGTGLDVRLGAQTVEPTGGLGDSYDYGYGAYARVGTPAGPFSLMGALTWTRFKPKGVGNNDLDIGTVQFGPHLAMMQGFDIGVEGAYFTNNEKFGISPVISIGLVNFEATLSYSMTFDNPRTSWLALGVGLKF